MTRRSRRFSEAQKRTIQKRVSARSETIKERLQTISSGRKSPKTEHMRLYEAKRYRIGTVFIDITNFSDYVFDNDPEEVLYMLNLFIPEVLQIVREEGGFFEKNTGDGILTYFGTGETDTESAETLLRFLATVKWALANVVNPELIDNDVPPVSISGGATYDKTYISRIGVKSGKQQMNRLTAVSEAANVASRLEESSNENEFLVGPRVHHYSDKDGWGSMLEPYDILPEYEWSIPDEETQRSYIVYNFAGCWDSTKNENLVGNYNEQ